MAESAGSLHQLSDDELTVLCAQRPVNEEAWEKFYERFHEFVQNQLRRRLGRIADLDDVAQDAFVKIFRVLPSYDPAKAQLKTYLSHILTNLAIDYFRRNHLANSMSSSLPELDSLQIQAAQNPDLLRAAAERIVRQLPDGARVQLMLDLLHGRDVKEICTERQLTESYVYGARCWLRDQLHQISASFPKY